MVTVVNYGIGNLGSVLNMLKRIGVKAELATTSQQIKNSDKIILPGVGAFDSCMLALKDSGMLPAIEEHTLLKKKPLLGICVGYQILTKSSEEGSQAGLGWLAAETIRFTDSDAKFKVPHMGWNYLKPVQDHALAKPFSVNNEVLSRAYFVHSYYVKAANKTDVLFETDYINPFASGMAADNIMGVQFHPEKSHKYGMQLFKAFSEIS
jgi:imidazole glycerol-phosphate synthase subunit HisH